MVAEGQIVIDAIPRRAVDVLLDEDPLIQDFTAAFGAQNWGILAYVVCAARDRMYQT